MKKVALGTLLFVLVLVLSFVLHFPTESVFRYYLHQLEKETGVRVDYTDGSFSFNRVEINNVDILKNSRKLFSLNEVTASYLPFRFLVFARKNGGSLEAVVRSDKTDLKMNNFKVVSNGEKFFKNITVSGDFLYRQKRKSGTGKLIVNLKDSLDPFIRSNVQARANLRVNPSQVNINISNISGVDITGNGLVVMDINHSEFSRSRLSGTLRLNTQGNPIRIDISGTIQNPSVVPRVSAKTTSKMN